MSGTPNGPNQPSPDENALTDFLENTTEGLHRLGPDGIILWANRAELDLLGYAPHEYIGHHAAEFHADRAVIDEVLQRLARGEAVRNHPARLVGKDGSLREVVINANALFVDGKFVHTRGCTRDATKLREAEETRARLGAIIDSCDDAIIGKTLDGVITAWNPGAERIFGYTASEAVGRHIALIIPLDRHAEENDVLARLRRGERIEHFETERLAKDGQKVSISLSVSPIRDGRGRVIGAAKVARDITQRKQAERERERLLAREKAARAEAEAAGRARDEFLATLSHELRTPLNAILGWARMLTSGQLDEKGRRRALEVIERNTETQNQLIADLLDVSRIITGKMTLIMRRLDLANVVQDALDSVRPTAGLKRIEFVARLEPNREVAWGDGDRLKQVIWNLLINAVKFTPEGGRVSTSLTYGGGHAVITVSDTGIGIRPEVLPYIFERFRQCDTTTARPYGGLGLGLAIVRHLVELHGGTVQATSEGEGRGATFIVELPVGVSLGRGLGRHGDQLSGGAVIRAEGVAAPSGRLAGVRALIVDDNVDTCELIETILEQQGAETTCATSVHDAVRALERARPDAMICDLAMPGRDGFEFIQYVRNRNDGKDIPAVAVTAFARDEDRERALAAGFNEYLAKPVEPVQVVDIVARAVGRP